VSEVRPLTKEDIPQLVHLHREVGLRGESSQGALESYFRELFLCNPWRDKELPSLIYQEENRKIIGFLGVVPRRMCLNGRPIRVACASSFMVHSAKRSSMAALRLLKVFFSGPQDLSMGDSANSHSRRVWEGLGGTSLLLYSLDWMRYLRPCTHYHRMTTLGMNTASRSLARAAEPISRLIDAVGVRIRKTSGKLLHSSLSEESLHEATLLACLSDSRTAQSLHGVYDAQSLNWLLGFMERTKGVNKFNKVLLRNERQEIAGWYLYNLTPSGLCQVLQIGAKHGSMGEVLDHLCHHAWRLGATSVGGRLEPRFAEALSESHCFFRSGSWTLVYSKDWDLLKPFLSGDAQYTPLDGEWCLRFTGHFNEALI